jgi:ribonuclease D
VWVEEELATLKDPITYRLEPVEAWRRLKARSSNKRFFAVLASVAAWREREAQERDVPRNRVLKDEALMEIASHPPADAEALEHIRAIPKGYANSRSGKALLTAVETGVNGQPPEGAVSHDHRRRGHEPAPAALDLLKTLLRLRANQYGVAPRLVADSEDLEKLASGDDEGSHVLHGWRAEVFGDDARALRDGRLAIALDAGEAVVIETAMEKKPRAKVRG